MKNIIQYIESFEVGEELWVVLEYMNCGSLYDIVKLYPTGVKLKEDETAYCIFCILKALNFLHNKKRIHRDIKIDNILLNRDGTVKLADFGTAVQLTFQKLRRNTLAGTPYYMAPELIQKIPYKEKVDIWSIGITVLEILTGRPPFYNLSPQEALESIVQKGVQGLPTTLNQQHQMYQRPFSREVVDFVNNKCLVRDPDGRASTEELLQHQFVLKKCSQQQFAKFLSFFPEGDTEKVDATSIGESKSKDSGCTLL